jgi:hypothetical protein
MKTKKLPKIAIPAPYTGEELRKLVKGEKVDKKNPNFPFEISDSDDKWSNPEFDYVNFAGVSFSEDEVLVDNTGKEMIQLGGLTLMFNWGARGIGFGQFRLTRRNDGKMEIDSEGTGKEFFARALVAMVNQAEEKERRWLRRGSSRKTSEKPNKKQEPAVH